jgi:predicted transposase YbfD/YdcC
MIFGVILMLDLKSIIEDATLLFEDKRQDWKVQYPLKELLLLGLLAVLSGMETFEEIEIYGNNKLNLLQEFYPYKNGIPSEITIGRFFRWLDPNCFTHILMSMVKILSPTLHNKLIAIDGKTIRGSHDGFKRPVHILSAFSAETKLVIGHLKVDDKTNEISMLPALLEMIDIEGAIVSLDAMGCQREISKTILEKKGDYLLSLKGNQGNLEKDTKELFESMINNREDYHVEDFEEVTANGSRVETRNYTVTDNIVRLQGLHAKNIYYEGVKSVIKVERKREYKDGKNKGKEGGIETAYYLCSRVLSGQEAAEYVRGHWGIENSLHHVLDVSYREDRSRIRKANAAENMNILRKITTNIIRTVKNKKSFKFHRVQFLLSDKRIKELFYNENNG